MKLMQSQIYFALSTLEQWDQHIGAFDLRKFYDHIMGVLTGNQKVWIRHTMSFWAK